MTHRSNDRGSLRIDKVYAGLPREGRLALATGTTDPKVFRQIVAMCDDFHEHGRLDVLESLQRRTLKFLVCLAAYRKAGARAMRVGTPEEILPLWVTEERNGQRVDVGAVATWIEEKDCTENYRDSLRSAFRALRKLATPGGKGESGATPRDLPALLERYRTHCMAAQPQKRVMYNSVRTAVSAFVGEKFGRRAELYFAVRESPTLLVTGTREPHPFPVLEARAFAERLGPKHGPHFWAQCLTGMRPKEYFPDLGGSWRIDGDRVTLLGAKQRQTGQKVRVVPVVDVAALARVSPVTVEWDAYREAFRRAIGGLAGKPRRRVRDPWPTPHVPYDARRTYTHWMEEAGIPRSRRKAYLGHAADDMTSLYERHEVVQYLETDTFRLRTYLGLGEDATGGLTLVKGDA